MKLAIISEGYQLWPLYVADARGLFGGAGTGVEIAVTGSSARQLDALRRGDYEIGMQQADHVVRAVEEGSDLFIFMAGASQPDLSLVVAPGVRGFEDLRGRTVVVDGVRTGYALLLLKLLAGSGLAPGDYTLLDSGGVKERYEAMRAGAGAMCWLNPPYDEWALAAR